MPDELSEKSAPPSTIASAVAQRPSKKQHELLSFIEGFVAQHGYGPSYREIMRGCDYKSVSTVAIHVDNLIMRGHLRKKTRSARSLEVIKSSEQPSASTKVAIMISKSQEKWLVDIVSLKFDDFDAKPTAKKYDQLCILVGSLSILGMKDAAVAAKARLSALPSH